MRKGMPHSLQNFFDTPHNSIGSPDFDSMGMRRRPSQDRLYKALGRFTSTLMLLLHELHPQPRSNSTQILTLWHTVTSKLCSSQVSWSLSDPQEKTLFLSVRRVAVGAPPPSGKQSQRVEAAHGYQ